MQDRLIFQRLEKTKKSVLLLGPRQVGKSTLCKTLQPKKLINLADESLFLQYAKDPGTLKREILALSKGPRDKNLMVNHLIVIDEVQRVPSLLNTVQALIDDFRDQFRFILTGSSARKLKRGGANLLPGRILLEYLDPMTCLELGEQFNLERALQLGMLPEIFLDRDEGLDILETYSEVYLREEIQAEALIKNIGSYARFLDAAAVMSGQWFNYSKVSSETEIPKETIRRFYSILEETLLIFKIPSFEPKRRISRRVSQKDKYYFFDIGVRNSLLGIHRHPISQDQIGVIFEHWFILQLIYLNRAYKKGWKLSTYRTEAGAEVDIVVERDQDIVGIEIKASKNVGKQDLRGLTSLAEVVGKNKPFKKWVAFRGENRQIFEPDFEIIPYLEVIQELFSEDLHWRADPVKPGVLRGIR